MLTLMIRHFLLVLAVLAWVTTAANLEAAAGQDVQPKSAVRNPHPTLRALGQAVERSRLLPTAGPESRLAHGVRSREIPRREMATRIADWLERAGHAVEAADEGHLPLAPPEIQTVGWSLPPTALVEFGAESTVGAAGGSAAQAETSPPPRRLISEGIGNPLRDESAYRPETPNPLR